jgi:L-ascorbate metabolism protein UlaG (beta-lactamase superfamily)
MEKVVKEGTTVVVPADCQSKVTRFKVPVKIEVVEPGRELNLGDIKLVAMPSYNIDKHFHPKEEGWIGYLIKMNEVLIYHAGDTDNIPEMQKLTGYSKDKEGREFVALLPVGGRFTMTAEEAADAAVLIKPTLAIPIHYGGVVGTDDDAKEFVSLCIEKGINAVILEKT